MYYVIKGSTLVGKADVAPNIEDLRSFGMDVVEDARNLDISTHEYVDGAIQVTPIAEYTAAEIKAQKIAEIKARYEARFKEGEAALMRARLASNDAAVVKLQAMYKLDLAAMAKEIKEV